MDIAEMRQIPIADFSEGWDMNRQEEAETNCGIRHLTGAKGHRPSV